MKKIGFIDYYLDEWHAIQYPGWLRQASGGEMEVAYAYGMKDSEHGLSNADWCRENGIELLDSIAKVVEASDYLIVLSPDNPEHHQALATLPLQSGKPTYVDKTFAQDRLSAQMLMDTAARHQTPIFSSSALRYATEYATVKRQGMERICSFGPGRYDNYAIHQIEPIVALMGTEPQRVMSIGKEGAPELLIEFSGGRQAEIHHFHNSSFSMMINYASDDCISLKVESDFFAELMKDMVRFFRTGQPSFDSNETIAIMTIIEYGSKAMQRPYEWVELPST